MQIEFQALGFMTLFFLFAWVPVSFGKIGSFGGRWLLSNRDSKPKRDLPLWAQRCDRAYNNLKEYFPAFIVAILILGVTRKFDDTTTYAAIIYVIGRIGHYISYGMGNVPLRVVFFFSALLSNTYLLIKIFI